MSFLKEAARPCRAPRHYTKAFRQIRLFSQSRSVAALTKEEVHGAHQYCVALLSYVRLPPAIAQLHLDLIINLVSPGNMIDLRIH